MVIHVRLRGITEGHGLQSCIFGLEAYDRPDAARQHESLSHRNRRAIGVDRLIRVNQSLTRLLQSAMAYIAD